MALYKRKKIYWINIRHNGKRIQRSTGTSDKLAALELHDKLKADLWNKSKLGKKSKKLWMDAVVRWVNESSHKRSLKDDQLHLRWLNTFLKDTLLDEITVDLIARLTQERLNTGVTNATVNRMLAVIRAILNKAIHDWEWIDKVPKVRLLKEDNSRIRWLTHVEAATLIRELPEHLKYMAIFTLATGLRQSNVKSLKWADVDLERAHAWIHPDEAKGRTAIAVPLNDDAFDVLKECMGKHAIYVFTYKGNSIDNVNTKAWRKALLRAGIEKFRWHDLRHTWASWHVQNGTSLQELQHLGAWSSFNMVLRYAHLSSAHLRKAALRIPVTNWLHSEKVANNTGNENVVAA